MKTKETKQYNAATARKASLQIREVLDKEHGYCNRTSFVWAVKNKRINVRQDQEAYVPFHQCGACQHPLALPFLYVVCLPKRKETRHHRLRSTTSLQIGNLDWTGHHRLKNMVKQWDLEVFIQSNKYQCNGRDGNKDIIKTKRVLNINTCSCIY